MNGHALKREDVAVLVGEGRVTLPIPFDDDGLAAHAAGVLFFSGTCIFSGSCYAAVLSRDRSNGRFAPVGGGLLILGWLSLAIL